ncbi:hypothetical protein IQ254_05365 [Nodosilinea sp. LEGE 07088]|uniref:hypothetical protein n=1 Tax=Nodosilinea sp. LEGE 07088 TaxID=2777968 RepID=UPI00187EC270|nr:hypothetical protein [Nodosilinea sp. LEGE 07088]MBE9136635.1 hypothetical protein [Nodosilinea sp. LEGE 07088]
MVLELLVLPVWLLSTVQLVLVPLCFVLAWSLVVITAWNLISAVRDGVSRATVMHKIPCAECRYFTNDHRLKCPIHPKVALSESAIDCADFEHAGLI